MNLTICSANITPIHRISFGNKEQTVNKIKPEEINNIKRILDFIQKNVESSSADVRSEMQAILHNITIKEGLSDTLKQQAKNLLLRSYM